MTLRYGQRRRARRLAMRAAQAEQALQAALANDNRLAAVAQAA
jgi:hypothetical protein